jgi:hypothetical protein
MDIRIYDEGTVIGFKGVSAAGKLWLAENVEEGDGTIWADHRCANDIGSGIVDAGLEMGN